MDGGLAWLPAGFAAEFTVLTAGAAGLAVIPVETTPGMLAVLGTATATPEGFES